MGKYIPYLVALFVFTPLALAIFIPLYADMLSASAAKYEEQYRWKRAESLFQKAVRIDRLNAELKADYAEFMIRRAGTSPEKISRYISAEKLLREASNLNPKWAGYKVRCAEVESILYALTRDSSYADKAGEDILAAIEDDPNGLNTCYRAGYAGLSVFADLDKYKREMVIEKLSYVMRKRQEYRGHIYKALWERAKDFNLLRKITPHDLDAENDLLSFILQDKYLCANYRKEQNKIIESLGKKDGAFLGTSSDGHPAAGGKEASNSVPRTEWRGVSSDGKYVILDGKMFWSGSISADILLPAGPVALKIKAKGAPARGLWPQMALLVDGEEVGDVFVESGEWKDYEFKIDSSGGVRRITIVYTNDGSDKKTKEDRNLFVGDAVCLN